MCIYKRLTLIIIFWINTFFACLIYGQSTALVKSDNEVVHLYPFLSFVKLSGATHLQNIDKNNFALSYNDLMNDTLIDSINFVKFALQNSSNQELELFLSIAFSDKNTLFIPSIGLYKYSGDLLPLNDRHVANGQLCFINFKIPKHSTYTCFLKLESLTGISTQFKDITIKSLSIYTKKSFDNHFEKPRYLQAFFYGALVIMFFFNFFLFLSTRSSSYFYYIFYLLILGVFLLSNSGYLFEFVLPSFPRTDLFIRFLSTPILLIAYILFSKDYLKFALYLPQYKNVLNGVILMLGIMILVMITGHWRTGRSAVIVLAIFTFGLILICVVLVCYKGYKPGRYFLAGNLLLITGAVIYALERLLGISYNTFGQHSLQFAVLLEVAVFSMGLADRINNIQLELSQTRFEKEKEEKEHQINTRNIIEDKNKQLDAYIYRTAHDIRGPLASMMGMCQLAIIEVKDTFAIDYFTKLNNISNRLSYILQRLTTVYEIDSLEYHHHQIPLIKLVEQVIAEVASQEIGAHVTFKIDTKGMQSVGTDKRMLYFILLNLIENAAKFKNPNAVDAHVVETQIVHAGTQVLITITDNGIGIKDEDGEKIYHLLSTAPTPFKTPGLGLYMVKSCLKKCGGSIAHQSANGKTTFSVYLPDAPIHELGNAHSV